MGKLRSIAASIVAVTALVIGAMAALYDIDAARVPGWWPEALLTIGYAGMAALLVLAALLAWPFVKRLRGIRVRSPFYRRNADGAVSSESLSSRAGAVWSGDLSHAPDDKPVCGIWPVDYFAMSLDEIGEKICNRFPVDAEPVFEQELRGKKIRAYGSVETATNDEIVIRGGLGRPAVRLRGIQNWDDVSAHSLEAWIMADGVIASLGANSSLELKPSRVVRLAPDGEEEICFDGLDVAGKKKPRLALEPETTSDRSLRLVVTNTGAQSRFAARVVRCVGVNGRPPAPWDLPWLSGVDLLPSMDLGRNETARVELARRPDPRPARENDPDPGRVLYLPRVGGGRRAVASRQEVELTVLFDGADFDCQVEVEVWIRTRSGDSSPDIIGVRGRHIVR